jgi:sarcosine oxidase, subunit delta
MQLFPCPFCGDRDETEFLFLGEAGKTRPAGGRDVAGAAWADYLHRTSPRAGRETEIWRHRPCGEVFLMERDTVSHVVDGARAIWPEAKP